MTDLRFYWDFFGPDARGTAEHFHRHLREFLTHYQLDALTTDVGSMEPGHAHCWCDTPAASVELIEQRLRPRRRYAPGTWPEEPAGTDEPA